MLGDDAPNPEDTPPDASAPPDIRWLTIARLRPDHAESALAHLQSDCIPAMIVDRHAELEHSLRQGQVELQVPAEYVELAQRLLSSSDCFGDDDGWLDTADRCPRCHRPDAEKLSYTRWPKARAGCLTLITVFALALLVSSLAPHALPLDADFWLMILLLACCVAAGAILFWLFSERRINRCPHCGLTWGGKNASTPSRPNSRPPFTS